jgi:hypothetical protein
MKIKKYFFITGFFRNENGEGTMFLEDTWIGIHLYHTNIYLYITLFKEKSFGSQCYVPDVKSNRFGYNLDDSQAPLISHYICTVACCTRLHKREREAGV